MILDGRLEPICAFFTNVSVVTDLSDVKRPLGMAVIAVDSMCRFDSAVRFINDVGSGPDGKALLPITWKACNPIRLPISSGSKDGTPGNVSCNDDTRPELSQETPFQAQNLTSFKNPPFTKFACPSELEVSKMAFKPQNWIAFSVVWASWLFWNEKLDGMDCRTGRHDEHGNEGGFEGALRLYCEMHCVASAESLEELETCGVLDDAWGIVRTRMFKTMTFARR